MKTNKFPAKCRDCGTLVPAGAGQLMPALLPTHRHRWDVVCGAGCASKQQPVVQQEVQQESQQKTTTEEDTMYSAEQIAAMKRHELVKAVNAQFTGAHTWAMSCTNDELRQALTTGQAPGKVAAVATTTAPSGEIINVQALVSLLAGQVKAGIDRDEVQAIVDEAVAKAPARRIEVVVRGKARDVGRQHEVFEDVLLEVGLRHHVMLVGPAGSGKTTLAEKVAESLDLPFYAQSCCQQTPESRLAGFIDAGGTFRSTVFFRAFTEGGVFLLDEADRANANTLNALNQALANGQAAFPSGMASKHADFVCIIAANTWGFGRDRQYVGAAQLDAAFLDRFVPLSMGYDEAFEQELATARCAEHGADWHNVVKAYRKAVSDLGLRYVVSPRATIRGAELLAVKPEWASRMPALAGRYITANWSAEDVTKVVSKVGEVK